MNMKIKDLIGILNKMDAEKDIAISEYDFQLGKWNRHVLEVSYITDKPQEVANDLRRRIKRVV